MAGREYCIHAGERVRDPILGLVAIKLSAYVRRLESQGLSRALRLRRAFLRAKVVPLKRFTRKRFPLRGRVGCGSIGLGGIVNFNERKEIKRAKTALQREAQRLVMIDAPLWQIHEWLCHPGERCADGCDALAIPERRVAYETTQSQLEMRRA